MWRLGKQYIVFFIIVKCTLGMIPWECGDEQIKNFKLGDMIDAITPNYPNNHQHSSVCRWRACSPDQTQFVVTCVDVRLAHTYCDPNTDRLEISYRGCPDLDDAVHYCSLPVEFRTASNRLVMALKFMPYSMGGAVRCHVRVEPNAHPAQPDYKYPVARASPFPRGPYASDWVPMVAPPSQPSPPPPYGQDYHMQPHWRFEESVIRYQPYSPSYQSQQQPYSPPYQMQQQPYSPPLHPYMGGYPLQTPYPYAQWSMPSYAPQHMPYVPYYGYPTLDYQQSQQQQQLPPTPPQTPPPQADPLYPPQQYSAFQSSYQAYNPPSAPPSPKCRCGERKHARIVGGEDVDIDQIPYVCGLKDIEHNTVFCGCTIISENFVLTAAHCLSNRTISSIHVITGTSDYNRANSRFGATYPIVEAIIHPDFHYQSLANDIALGRVTLMQFNPAVQAVCLPISDRFRYGDYFSQVEIAGYGETAFSAPLSSQLKVVTLNIIDNRVCSETYPGIITNEHACSQTPNKGACAADNGAGLCVPDKSTNLMFIDSVAGSSLACGTNMPLISFRVAPNIPWIMSATNENFCII